MSQTYAKSPCPERVRDAIRALNAALTTEYHVRDFTFEVRAFGEVLAKWDGVEDIRPASEADLEDLHEPL